MYHPVTFPGVPFTWLMLVPAAVTSLNTVAPPVAASAMEIDDVTFEASTTGAELSAVACPFGLFGLYAMLFCFYIINQFDADAISVTDEY